MGTVWVAAIHSQARTIVAQLVAADEHVAHRRWRTADVAAPVAAVVGGGCLATDGWARCSADRPRERLMEQQKYHT